MNKYGNLIIKKRQDGGIWTFSIEKQRAWEENRGKGCPLEVALWDPCAASNVTWHKPHLPCVGGAIAWI